MSPKLDFWASFKLFHHWELNKTFPTEKSCNATIWPLLGEMCRCFKFFARVFPVNKIMECNGPLNWFPGNSSLDFQYATISKYGALWRFTGWTVTEPLYQPAMTQSTTAPGKKKDPWHILKRPEVWVGYRWLSPGLSGSESREHAHVDGGVNTGRAGRQNGITELTVKTFLHDPEKKRKKKGEECLGRGGVYSFVKINIFLPKQEVWKVLQWNTSKSSLSCSTEAL